jgi:hypothetical protein
MGSDEASQRALEFLLQQYRDSIRLSSVASLPSAVYGFDPRGWLLFVVLERNPRRLGGTEHVAVDGNSGKVRSLGLLGE